jgi:thymidylate synthase (FAD)
MNIYILGKPYDVEMVDDAHTSGNMGSANRSLQKILIASAIGKDQQQDTLLHEVLHIINDELKVGLTEENVSRLAVGLYSAGYAHPIVK